MITVNVRTVFYCPETPDSYYLKISAIAVRKANIMANSKSQDGLILYHPDNSDSYNLK